MNMAGTYFFHGWNFIETSMELHFLVRELLERHGHQFGNQFATCLFCPEKVSFGQNKIVLVREQELSR